MSLRFDAYAAGLVDGEGCITAKATKSETGMGIRVLIGMATKAQAVLARMQDTYGGTLITQSPTNPAHSPITTWTVTGSEAAAFLRRIESHLLLKDEQARVALKIDSIRTSQERIGSRDHFRWTEDNLSRCRVLHRRLNELNARGRESSPPPAGKEFARLVAGQWVTDQADLFSDLGWEPFTGTWPRSGSMRSGRVYERPTSAPHTTGSGCSFSLPTPKARDYKGTNSPGGHARNSPDLSEISAYLPTITASDADRERNNPAQANRKSPPISAVSQYFPTPNASDGSVGGQHPSKRKGHSRQLIDFVLSIGDHTDPLFDAGSV